MTCTNALDILTARAEARLANREEAPSAAPVGPVLPTLHQAYTKPLPVTCFVDIAPNNVLLSPLRKPFKTEAGLITSSKEEATSAVGCVAYVVLGVGELVATPESATFLSVEAGDIVAVRNMILEPLCPAEEPLLCHRSGVLAKLQLADVKFAVKE